VVEDLADEVGIGDVANHSQHPAAPWTEGNVYFEYSLQALRPGQRRGGRIVAVVARFCGIVLPGCWRSG
jgi:hypothetical protein